MKLLLPLFFLASLHGQMPQQALMAAAQTAAGGGGGITFVSDAANDGFNNSAGNIAKTSYSITSGNLVVVGCGGTAATDLHTTWTPTDGLGNTYTFVDGATDTVATGLWLYQTIATTGGSTTVTCNVGITGWVFIGIVQFSGANATPTDVSGHKGDFNSGNATLTSTSFTPGASTDAAVGCFFSSTSNGTTITDATGGYTLTTAPANTTGQCEYKLNIGTSAQTTAGTFSPNRIDKAMGVGAFKQ